MALADPLDAPPWSTSAFPGPTAMRSPGAFGRLSATAYDWWLWRATARRMIADWCKRRDSTRTSQSRWRRKMCW